MTGSERLTTWYLDVRVRLEAATPGPWTADDDCDVRTPDTRSLARVLLGDEDTRDEPSQALADAEFIAHAREDVPELLDALDRIREFAQQLRQTTGSRISEVVGNEILAVLDGPE